MLDVPMPWDGGEALPDVPVEMPITEARGMPGKSAATGRKGSIRLSYAAAAGVVGLAAVAAAVLVFLGPRARERPDADRAPAPIVAAPIPAAQVAAPSATSLPSEGRAKEAAAVPEEVRRREAEARAAVEREAERRSAEKRAAQQRDAEEREAERQAAEKRAAEQQEAERRDAVERETRRPAVARRTADKRASERQEAERRAAEKRASEQQREAERQAAEKTATTRASAGTPVPAADAGKAAPDQQEVQDAIARSQGELDACMREAREDPEEKALLGRKVTLSITVNPNGRVTKPAVDDEQVEAATLGYCIKRVGVRLTFSAFKGDKFQVRLPIVLKK